MHGGDCGRQKRPQENDPGGRVGPCHPDQDAQAPVLREAQGPAHKEPAMMGCTHIQGISRSVLLAAAATRDGRDLMGGWPCQSIEVHCIPPSPHDPCPQPGAVQHSEKDTYKRGDVSLNAQHFQYQIRKRKTLSQSAVRPLLSQLIKLAQAVSKMTFGPEIHHLRG
eukprot:1150122-Pelagomonas_calceolata.AAC.1